MIPPSEPGEPLRPADARLDLVPENPGVYLMKDAAGSIIYVGKAVNLRNRLRSYFTPNPQGNAKVLAMISHIADFSFIVTGSELEALMLEATLIKQHHPHYNILLRDDKGYPYVRITMNERYPRILKAYRVGSDKKEGARYYGPYLSGDLSRALEALKTIFPTKTCNRVLPRDIGKERPCLNYYIGRCIGPCRGDVPAAAYRAVMESICQFFEGKYRPILDDLRRRMDQAAAELKFEEASLWRDRIRALEKLMERQQAVSTRDEDRDVIGMARNGSESCVQKLEIREGRIVSAASFFFPDEEAEDPEILSAFLLQHYCDVAVIPPEIFLPAAVPEQEDLQAWLAALRSGRCQLHVPQRGDGRRLITLASENAELALRRHTMLGGHGQTALQEAIRELAQLTGAPSGVRRIEAVDISHTGGSDMAASLVVFLDGRPARQQYRHFKIRTLTGPDDGAAIREVLRRRFAHLGDEPFGSRPDLILLDGGRAQVQAARTVLAEFGLALPVAGMVKDEKHRTRGLVLTDGRTIELRQQAEAQDAQALGLLRLLTAIQDEAHRFARRLNQSLQSRRNTRLSLEAIPGIGPARRRLLLEHFKTIRGVSEASLEELAALPGLGEAAARAVYSHFHPEAD
jgi:excinuclease ABC subunit C